MAKFVVGFILGIVAIYLIVYAYFASGLAPVATSASPMPFEAKFANIALHAKIEREMPKTVPIQPDAATYAAGAQVYKNHCAVCHGLPGQDQTAISKGMFPKPPKLLEGKGVTDDPPGETYWKVDNGIRMSGMPGFGKNLSTTQMWQVSLLLANADKLPEQVKVDLATTPTPSVAAPAPKQ
jgi:thiosulfate dehydrogenase